MVIADIKADLDEYADWEMVGSATRAWQYALAAKRYLQIAPTAASNQSSSISVDLKHVADEMRRATAFAKANSSRGGGSVRHLGVARDFR